MMPLVGMSDKKNLRLKQLHGRLGDLVYQFTRVQFSQPPVPEGWSPPINAYRCQHGFAICVELAGMNRDDISIEVESRKIRVFGKRPTPEPKGKDHETSQIIAMEIDSGSFSREVTFSADVETDSASAEYKDGLLWVYLPFRTQA